MVAITFPTSSSPGLYPQESAGRLINGFVEKTEPGAPGQTLWRRSAGLYWLGSGPGNHTRGFMPYVDVGDTAAGGWTLAFWVTNDQLAGLVKDIATGNYTVNVIGPLAGTKPITMARNNRFPIRQAVAVTENGCFIIANDTAGAIPPIPFVDTDLPPKPTSVCSHDGYFVWSYLDGRVFASQLNGGTVSGELQVNALSFNTEQGQSVLRVVSFSGRMYAMGDKWIGVYRDAGTVPFPFLREATVPRGLLNTHAVAGWEPGWSNELIWVGDDHVVYKLNGYVPVPISNDAVTRAIQRNVLFRGKEHIEAFVYMYGRNAFWVLNSYDANSPEADFTWEYNLMTGQWNERRSLGHAGWRGHKSIKSRDEWILGDLFNASFYIIKEEFFAEGHPGGDFVPHVWTIESGVMSGFPQRVVIPRASFNITAGVGYSNPLPGIGVPVPNPTVAISWSLDGGYTWGVPVIRSLGIVPRSGLTIPDTRYYPSVICSGLSRGHGVRYRLEVEDPVHVGLSGGEIDFQPRAPI